VSEIESQIQFFRDVEQLKPAFPKNASHSALDILQGFFHFYSTEFNPRKQIINVSVAPAPGFVHEKSVFLDRKKYMTKNFLSSEIFEKKPAIKQTAIVIREPFNFTSNPGRTVSFD
jgi:hypothetical protein